MSDLTRADTSVRVEITGLRAVRLDSEKIQPETSETSVVGAPVKFDVSARLEEKERRSGKIVVLFVLTIGTKPSVAKFELEGYAIMTGTDDALARMLEIDPKTGVPLVFNRVYQHLFTAMYLLASLMGTVYPPPDLLFLGKDNIRSDSTSTTETGMQPPEQTTVNLTREEKPVATGETAS